MSSLEAITGSMLWSAFGDALGFMSELVDRTGLVQRTGHERLERPLPWKHRVGGRYGATVSMPAGMYSDDTQLRLATARCISHGGDFNVDAFAKVELPVWLSYALGGGRATKAAAQHLSRDNVTWFANFYSVGDARYTDSGGNGAAMRVQPHVWAAPAERDRRHVVLDVLRNSVTTHGHSRAILGAVFHADCLARIMRDRRIPEPTEWRDSLAVARELPSIMARDEYLASMWLPEWERRVGSSFEAALLRSVEECEADMGIFSTISDRRPEQAYEAFLQQSGGFDAATRGSGVKTALAALALAWLFRDRPIQGLRAAANALGSDTDTIATMAGALLGAVVDSPPGDLCDLPLLATEARRLHRIAEGQPVSDFPHPSLLSWRPPRSATDAVGTFQGGMALAGFGKLTTIDDVVVASSERTPSTWRWAKMSSGQTILVKARANLTELEPTQMPTVSIKPSDPSGTQAHLFQERGHMDRSEHSFPRNSRRPDLDEYSQIVIRSNFDPAVIGRILLEISEQPNGIENAIGFASIVAKARVRRVRTTGQ